MLLLPYNGYNKETYVSENALLPAQVWMLVVHQLTQVTLLTQMDIRSTYIMVHTTSTLQMNVENGYYKWRIRAAICNCSDGFIPRMQIGRHVSDLSHLTQSSRFYIKGVAAGWLPRLYRYRRDAAKMDRKAPGGPSVSATLRRRIHLRRGARRRQKFSCPAN